MRHISLLHALSLIQCQSPLILCDKNPLPDLSHVHKRSPLFFLTWKVIWIKSKRNKFGFRILWDRVLEIQNSFNFAPNLSNFFLEFLWLLGFTLYTLFWWSMYENMEEVLKSWASLNLPCLDKPWLGVWPRQGLYHISLYKMSFFVKF